MGKEFRELYAPQPSIGDLVRGLVTFTIPDGIPDQEEINEVLRALRNGWALGASGMTVEDLKWWYEEHEENPRP